MTRCAVFAAESAELTFWTQVEEAMKVFDKDGSGSLDFAEFVVMFCKSEAFKFRVRTALIHCHFPLLALTTNCRYRKK